MIVADTIYIRHQKITNWISLYLQQSAQASFASAISSSSSRWSINQCLMYKLSDSSLAVDNYNGHHFIQWLTPQPLCLISATDTHYKQGVALTGHNTTGPPSRAAPWWVTLRRRRVLQMTTDEDYREQNTTGLLNYVYAAGNKPSQRV